MFNKIELRDILQNYKDLSQKNSKLLKKKRSFIYN